MPTRPHSRIVGWFCSDPAMLYHLLLEKRRAEELRRLTEQLSGLLTRGQGSVIGDDVLQLMERIRTVNEDQATSRMTEFVTWALNHPINPHGRLPHVIRNEGPAAIIGSTSRALGVLEENLNVLAGAQILVAEGHSDCYGVKMRHLPAGDQFEIQADMLRHGIKGRGGLQAFAQHWAVEADANVTAPGENVTAIGRYTWFGPEAQTEKSEDVLTVQAIKPLPRAA